MFYFDFNLGLIFWGDRMVQYERDCPYAKFRPILNPLVDIVLGHGVGEVSKLVKYLAVNPVYLIIPYNRALTTIFNLQFRHRFSI